MSAAKVTNVLARLPGCDGQAADAVSATTQVKMEDAPKMLRIPKSECPDVLDTSTNGPNRGQTFLIQWFFMNKTCTVIHLPDCYGRENSELGMYVRSS